MTVSSRKKIFFWKRWTREYSATVQKKGKMEKLKENLLEGMVTIKKENTPPTQVRSVSGNSYPG